MAVDDPLTEEERAAFLAICPAGRIVLDTEWGSGLAVRLGVAAFFADGSKQAMRMWCMNAADRAHFLRTAAIKLRDWHHGQTRA